jgi:hypothetical protein
MPEPGMTSFRMPPDLLAALRKRAEDSGESLSETMRRAALTLLGTCPTCGQGWKPGSMAETATPGESND